MSKVPFLTLVSTTRNCLVMPALLGASVARPGRDPNEEKRLPYRDADWIFKKSTNVEEKPAGFSAGHMWPTPATTMCFAAGMQLAAVSAITR